MADMTVYGGGGKSSLRAFYDKVTSGLSMAQKPVQHAVELGRNIRQTGESALVGAGLGALHAYKGLDQMVSGKKVPVDAALAAAGIIAAVAAPYHEITPELRNIGASAASVYSFRKAYEFVIKKNNEPTSSKMHGEGDSDGCDDEFCSVAANL